MQAMLPGVSTHTVPCAPLSAACAADMPMLTASDTTGATAALEIDLRERDVLRIGGEWLRFRLDDWWPASGGGMWPGTFWNIRDGRRLRSSLYAEWEGALAPQWTALAGVRATRVRSTAGPVQGYDSDPAPPGSYLMSAADAAAFNARDRHRSDQHLDAIALLRYSPFPTLDVEAGIGQKTRSPNLYERYAWSTLAMAAVMNNTVGDGNGYVGDIGLRPERARTLSATLDWDAAGRDPAWGLRITLWITDVADYIDAVPVTRNGPGRSVHVALQRMFGTH